MEATKPSTTYPPLDPNQLALELGVALTQRKQPNLRDQVPSRFVPLEEAKARDMSWCYDTSLGECRYAHIAARRTANVQICSDCERVKAGQEPIYGKSRANKHFPEPRRKSNANAPVVIAPPAPAAPPELPKREVEFMAALEETRDFDKAAATCNWSRGLIEARMSSNEPFRKAVLDLCERRGIAQKRAPDSSFTWSQDIERNLLRRFVDTGLLETARSECGVTASDYFSHLESSPTFAAAIEAARPRAREVLRDLATRAASIGNVNLLKLLEEDAPESTANMSVEQMNAEITKLLQRFDKMGLFPTEYRHRVTGQVIDLSEFDRVDGSNNSDLVS